MVKIKFKVYYLKDCVGIFFYMVVVSDFLYVLKNSGKVVNVVVFGSKNFLIRELLFEMFEFIIIYNYKILNLIVE